MLWHLEKRLLKDLKENPHNPRTLSKTQCDHLKKSLEKFGVCEPIVINTDCLIVGGHQRVKICKSLGKKEIEVYVPDRTLTDDEVNELSIRLNKNIGDWDFDTLANEWNFDNLIEWGFNPSELGYTDEEPKEEEECAKCQMCGQKLKKKK